MAFSLCAVSNVVNAAYQLSLADTWRTESDDGTILNVVGSCSVDISLPLTNVDITLFDKTTPFSLVVGPSSAVLHSGFLGDDPSYSSGSRSATFAVSDGNKKIGVVTVSWTTTTVTLTCSAHADAMALASYFSGFWSGLPVDNSYKLTGNCGVSIQLGNFTYANQNVLMTGTNSETMYYPPAGFSLGGDFGPYPLETGWMRGSVDVIPPVITILSPTTAAAKVHDGTTIVHLQGNVSDKANVLSVECIVNGNTNNLINIDQQSALPATSLSWTASMDLSTTGHVGSNIVTVIANDSLGNSTSVSRAFLWIETNVAVVTVNPPGAGMVKGLTSGQTLEIGVGYPVTAKPANHNWIFSGWSNAEGNPLESTASFSYMDTDGTLTANFAPNPFNNTALAGTYTALFYDTNNGATPNDAGYINVTVMETGDYSGRIYLAASGTSAPFSGQLSVPTNGSIASGASMVEIGSSGTLVMGLQFVTDTNLMDAGAGRLGGFVGSYPDIALAMAGSNMLGSSEIFGNLSAYNTNILPGLYNAAVAPASSDPSIAPGGYGYVSATVKKNGSVALILNLADGTSQGISFFTSLAQDGYCPLYASLYNGNGVILGWLQFATNGSGTILTNTIQWVKLSTTGKFYTNGFTTNTTVSGALYVPPKAGANVFGWTAGVLDLGPTVTNSVDLLDVNLMFDPMNNTFSTANLPAAQLSLGFAPSTGLVTGRYFPAGTRTSHPFHCLEVGSSAFGFYAGTNHQTGPILLAPDGGQ